MTEAQAHIAFNILVLHAGANPDLRTQFVHYACRPQLYHEFRFQGLLGFGGKIYFNDRECYVSCYPEDETPARGAVIWTCNRLLALLYK